MSGCLAVLNAGSSSIKFAIYEAAEGEPLSGARVDHRQLAGFPPGALLLRRVPVHPRDGGPGDQGADALAPRLAPGGEDGGGAAAAVAEQAETAGVDALRGDLAAGGCEHPQQVGQLRSG